MQAGACAAVLSLATPHGLTGPTQETVISKKPPKKLSAHESAATAHATPENPTAPAAPPPFLPFPSPRVSLHSPPHPSAAVAGEIPGRAQARGRRDISSHVAPRAEPQRGGAQQVGGDADEHQRRQGPPGRAQDQPRTQGHHQDVICARAFPTSPFRRPAR
jgi:hypothetical protein